MSDNLSEFTAGVRSAVAPFIAAMPFGLLFGALAMDNGLSVSQTLLMSATVFAGASQMVGIDLFGQNLPGWLIVVSIFAVNFRHVLYSAVFGRRVRHFSRWQRWTGFFFLIDPHFAEMEKRAEAGRTISFAWFVGGGLTWWLLWQVATLAGALFGQLIEDPVGLGIDLLLPIYFLGMVMGFRRRVRWLAVVVTSGTASMLGYVMVGSPWHVSLGAVAGVALAAVLGGRGETGKAEGAHV